jgi:serine/threonine protein kinase
MADSIRNATVETASTSHGRRTKFIGGRVLGSGGFGAVYEGSDTRGDKYAFKFICHPSNQVSEREMIPYRLEHENIIEIQALWQLTSRVNQIIRVPENLSLPVYFIQMELCDYTLYHKLYKVSVSQKLSFHLPFYDSREGN